MVWPRWTTQSLAVVLLLVGCASPTTGGEAGEPDTAPASSQDPTEPSSPTANPGADSATSPPLTVAADSNPPAADDMQAVTVLEGLEHPWGMVWLPDGTMLITERPGRVRRVRDGVLDPVPLSGVAPVLAERQGGLLDIALHPQFDDNRWVYFAYAHGTSEANRLRVARAKLEDRGAASGFTDWTVIFETNRDKPQGQHY